MDIIGAQIDSVVVDDLPVDVEFDVAIRLVGTIQDFAVPHAVQVSLSDPELALLGNLDIPVPPREPAVTRIPGYEINSHVAARIKLPGDAFGGYDLSFALDGEPAHRHKATISVVQQP